MDGSEAKVLEDMRTRFRVLKEFDIGWPNAHWERSLACFYGKVDSIWEIKRNRNGAGAFRVVVVEDPSPKWMTGEDMLGRADRINANLVDYKRFYRKHFAVKHSLHSATSLAETRRNFYMLFGQTLEEFLSRGDLDGAVESLNPPVPPPLNGWNTWDDLKVCLKECARHVFVKEEGAPEDEIHLLVDSLEEFAAVANARKLTSKANDPRWHLIVGGERKLINVTTPVSGRYPRAWALKAIAESLATDVHTASIPSSLINHKPRLDFKAFIDCTITAKDLHLYLFPRAGLGNIIRFALRLGGLYKIDFCLGEQGTF